MTIVTAVFIYFLVWWLMLFTILPMGVERHTEDGKGFDAGAPKFANLKKKLIINSVASAVVVLIMHVLIEMGIIRWSEWFAQ